MKKKALLVFILIFWLVGACTFLDMKVEEEMIPQVTAIEPDRGLSWDSDPTLPGDCLIEDENGLHLYKIYEGTGWEAGTRVSEEQGWFPDENGKLVVSNAWGDFVQYSSKPLREGEIVEVIRRGDKVEDHWLAVFPEGGMPEIDISNLPNGIGYEESGGSAMQFYVSDDQAPFMSGRAKSRVPELYGATVYSFNDMAQLLENFTGFGLLLGILAAVVVLWIFSCVFSREARLNRWYLCVNLVIAILLLACVPLVLDTMDLPSSLLPRERITDFGTVTRAMDEFFGALKGFAPPAAETGMLAPALPESAAGQAMINARNMVIARPVLYCFLGAFFAALTALGERAVMYIRRRPRIK